MNDARCYTSPIADSIDEETEKAFDELKEKSNRSAKAFWHLDKLVRDVGFDCCIFAHVNLPKDYTAFAFLKYGEIEYIGWEKFRNTDVYLLAYEDGSLLHNDLQNYTYYDDILAQIAEQLIAGKKIMLVHAKTVIMKNNSTTKDILVIDKDAKPVELDNNAAQCFLFDVMLEGWLAD